MILPNQKVCQENNDSIKQTFSFTIDNSAVVLQIVENI
jgi:hypothetical protein